MNSTKSPDRAEARVDAVVVGDVVAVVALGRGLERRQPERVDAQPLEIVEPPAEPSKSPKPSPLPSMKSRRRGSRRPRSCTRDRRARAGSLHNQPPAPCSVPGRQGRRRTWRARSLVARRRSSTRSIRGRSATATATASATWRASGAPRPPVVARRGRHLALAVLPLADGRLRLRRRRLLRRRPGVRHAGGPRPAGRRGPRPRHPGAARLGAEPHLGPAPVVPRVPVVARRPEARLVRLARRPRRRAAEQLAGRPSAGRPGRSTRPPASGTCTCSSPSSPTSTGRNPDGRRGHARRAAVLARPRRRRLPHRRGPLHRQGPELPDEPAELGRSPASASTTTRGRTAAARHPRGCSTPTRATA